MHGRLKGSPVSATVPWYSNSATMTSGSVGDVGRLAASTVQASNDLRWAVGVLLRRAQKAGAVRDDIDLPELYALLIGTSRAAAYAHLDTEVQARALAIVFDGLAPRATKPHDGTAAGSHRQPPPT
jgi:hypothetical protein